MAYVPGYSHDVFVSYAHDDNEMVRFPDGQGWVDTLVDKLRRLLKPRLGSRDLEFFLDREFMRSNLPITSQLLDAVRSSATLVVVMSPSYLVSPWCDRERRAFLDVVKDRVASGSIFLVRAVPVDHDKEPEELRDLTGIKLYTPVEGPEKYRTLGYPDSNELPFISSITRLAGELAEQLKRARGGAADGPSTPGSGGELAARRTGKRVFVAPATDDLEDREVELRSHLQQAGLEVLPSPQSRYPMTDLAAYEAAVLHELEGCCLFAQVLSRFHGKDLPFTPGKRLPALQHELAVRAKKPVLQWRERGQNIEGVQDPEHRALLEASQACGIDEFKRTVVERALHPPAERTGGHKHPVRINIFVDADLRDHGLELEVSHALDELGVLPFRMPVGNLSPTEVRTALKMNVEGCDGLVLVYGETEPYWVQEQLRQVTKVNPELSTIAVFEGPPAEKPEIGVESKDLDVLNCRRGLDLEKLRQFVERLRNTKVGHGDYNSQAQ